MPNRILQVAEKDHEMICRRVQNELNLRPFSKNRNCKALTNRGLVKGGKKTLKKIAFAIFYLKNPLIFAPALGVTEDDAGDWKERLGAR
jgi:hypothetical protein